MARTIESKLTQIIFEVRYPKGYRYLDQCGQTMLELEELLEKQTERLWMPNEMAPTGARIKCPDLNLNIMFDSRRAGIDQTPPEESCDFRRLCITLLTTVRSRFGIHELERFGYRKIWLLPTDSLEEAEALSLTKAPFESFLCDPPNGLARTDVELVTVFENPEHDTGLRVQFKPLHDVGAPIEADPRLAVKPRSLHEGQREALIAQLRRQQIRRTHPDVGLAFDIDYYRIRPSDGNVGEFIEGAEKAMESFLQAFMAKK